MSFDDPSPPAEQTTPEASSGEPLVPVSQAASQAPGSGIQVSIEHPQEMSKGLSLLRWYAVPFVDIAAFVTLLPAILIMLGLVIGAAVVEIISWFTVLFTKRVPPGLFNYQMMVIRYYLRVETWRQLMSDEYPMNFAPEGTLTAELEYPDSIPRWRGIPLLSYIMALPQLIVGGIIVLLGYLLVVLPPFIPGVTPLIVLATGTSNEGIFNFVRGGLRLYARGAAYAAMLAPTWEFSMD
jgi:hypothetical protein